MRSSIVGQRKPQAFKRKNRKHTTNRRYSEGESSDYESKPQAEQIIQPSVSTSHNAVATARKSAAATQMQPPNNKHDSGVDLSDGTDYGCSNGKLSGRKEKKQHQSSVKKLASVMSSDLAFKCGMIFDIEM